MPHLKYSRGKWIPTSGGFVHADDDGEEMTANTRLMAAASGEINGRKCTKS